MTTATNKTHPDYAATLPLWTKVRDTQSEEAVKAKATKYLPRLASQEDVGNYFAAQDYANYLSRASVYGAVGRTLAGLTGTILRKPASVEGVPDASLAILTDNAGRDFQPFDQIQADVVRELCSVGRVALLVDKDRNVDGLPYLLTIRAEDVVFWRCDTIDGRDVPSTIALGETYEVPKDGDPIGNQFEVRPQWRVLRLGRADMLPPHISEEDAGKFAGAIGPVYWQEIWRFGSGADKDKFGLIDVIVPTKNGGRFWNEIPCDIVNATGGIAVDVEEPPILPLANVVLAHYRNSADHEWALHLTATPQPWASGFDVPEGQKLVTGCGYAWITPQTGAQVAYLEFSGAGVTQIAEAMAAKEQQMAVLGARMLEAPKNAAEAMGTVRLRQAGERSILAGIAANASAALSRAVQRWLSWQSPAFDADAAKSSVVVRLDSDFDAVPLQPQELQTLVAALQAGTISWETFSHNVRRGELLPPGVTEDEERRRIQVGAPGRSRKEELVALQADVTAGRITNATYLAQVQALGYLAGVDVAKELAAIEMQASSAQEAQLMMLRRVEGERIESDGEEVPAA